MTKPVFIIVLIFLSANITLPQTVNDRYFISLIGQGGIFISDLRLSDEFKPGINGGVELQYGNIKKAVYLDVQYNSFEYKGTHNTVSPLVSNYSLSNESKSSITEIACGLRFFIGEEKFKGFLEGGLGLYFFKRNAYIETYKKDTVNYTRSYEKSVQNKFWLHIGAGVVFSVSKKIGILIKGKLHISNEIDKFITYEGIYTGVKYDF